VLVRPAAASEAGAIAMLAEATFRESWQAFNSPADMDAYCAAHFTPALVNADFAVPGVRLLVAEAGGALAGYLRWQPGGMDGVVAKLPAELSRLYVRRAFHGRGVGPALMRAFLEDAARAGHDVAWLAVWQQAPQPIAFYRKWGFATVGETTFRLGEDLQDDYVMCRGLADFAAPAACGV
jgi:ribosomal protein S18 acetylase RimI-like enzyme